MTATITINRATVEQALEALTAHADLHGTMYLKMDAITALRAALAQQAEAETCTWQQDGDSESGLYATSCRRYFSLDDGTPENNKMAWCCFCGKRLVQELIAEEDDDE